MKTCGAWPVGICSWSLQKDLDAVADAMKTMGVTHVHLALRPGLEGNENAFVEKVKEKGWTISCTMIDFPAEDYSTMETIRKTGGVTPDNAWDTNRRLFAGAAKLTKRLGVQNLSMHAGFIDERDKSYARKITDRIRMLADLAGASGIRMLMETGQETAEELKHFIESVKHPAIGVNFDPANMILYEKGDPVQAIEMLGRWVRHIHIKDAVRTEKPGTWGTEVPWGEGQVDHAGFLAALEKIGYKGCLAIEREAGNERVSDINLAVERLSRFKR